MKTFSYPIKQLPSRDGNYELRTQQSLLYDGAAHSAHTVYAIF